MTQNQQPTTNNQQRFAWPTILILSAAAICVLAFAHVNSPVRLAVGLWFVIACPGLALVKLLRIGGPITEWTLAIAVSIALDTAVSTVMVYAGQWSPNRGLAVLAAICVAGALLQLGRRAQFAPDRQVLP